MTPVTRQATMTLCQREFTVIKTSVFPIRRVMAQGAICSVSAFMGINFFVAGITINRRSLELTVNMAVFTLHFDMLSIQLERKNIMVHIHIVPVIRVMTICT
jgi:hypothetical protein